MGVDGEVQLRTHESEVVDHTGMLSKHRDGVNAPRQPCAAACATREEAFVTPNAFSVRDDSSASAARCTSGEAAENLWVRLRTHLVFALFGFGGLWIGNNASYVQLSTYQRRYGLMTANRSSIGGTLAVAVIPMFAIMRRRLRNSGKSIPYVPLIYAIGVVNACVFALFMIDFPSVWVYTAIVFLACCCGYSAGIVHQGYIVTHCDNVYLASFYAGDSAASTFAALLAFIQQSERAEQDQRFSLRTFYAVMTIFVPLSLAAFRYIHCHRVWLLTDVRMRVDARNVRLIEVPSSVPGSSTGGIEVTDVHCRQSDGFRCKPSTWLPACARKRPYITTYLSLVAIWVSFSNWGMADSILPFACANASSRDQGADCVLRSSSGCFIAELAANSIAACITDISSRSLRLPLLLYTSSFIFLCLAAAMGGLWANPWRTIVNTRGPSVNVETDAAVGEVYVAGVFLIMRFCGAMLETLIRRLTQVEYEQPDWEDAIFMFVVAGNASTVLGLIVATVILQIWET
eukprot:TRINITY_DN5755_c1_g1_i7.p1 TRINITY_DN5755_c1_g1~~TRINITY_DN5755_c1_g1_i7.p1  ORF type:complete len:516 (-),score=42.89 TRINITY_DN5755_c1_g1_i7:54-1601(-)